MCGVVSAARAPSDVLGARVSTTQLLITVSVQKLLVGAAP